MDINDITCVLLHGASGSGKSDTAKLIAAPQGLVLTQKYNDTVIHSNTRALSSPLGEMHNVKVNTKGANKEDRQLWMIHQTISEIIPPLSTNFENFIELTYDILDYPISEEAAQGGTRDRDFMTYAADACHSLVDNPFAKYAIKNTKAEYKELISEHKDKDVAMKYLMIISDLRLRREWDLFHKNFPNIMKIKLDVSPEAQAERLMARDNKELTATQLEHETQVSPFDDEEFDLVVKSDNFTLQDQVSMIKEYIFNEMTSGVTV